MSTVQPNLGIDVVSIFPEYLDALELSLVGKARKNGLVRLAVHNLRDWTTDRHRTVDDTPYGGGAGMVMKPDVWGQALDATLTADARLLIPTPADRKSTSLKSSHVANSYAVICMKKKKIT